MNKISTFFLIILFTLMLVSCSNKITVTFDSDGGTTISSKIIKPGDTVGIVSDPSKTGYAFCGWYLNGELYDFEQPVNQNISLIAYWIETYTVEFDSGGGTTISSKTVKSGDTVEVPSDPSKTGNIFCGWYLNGILYDFSKPVTQNIKLVALWKNSIVRVLINSDFIDNFTLSISKTYYKTFNGFNDAVFYDITLSKKYNFTLANKFALTVQVWSSDGTWRYINETINVSDFNNSAKVVIGPTSFVEGFDFHKYTIKIVVTNLG